MNETETGTYMMILIPPVLGPVPIIFKANSQFLLGLGLGQIFSEFIEKRDEYYMLVHKLNLLMDY